MRHLLKKEGFEVLVAADGREALTTLRSVAAPRSDRRDINLPPQDGFEFLRAIRSNRAWLTIPFSVLTDRHELSGCGRAIC